MPRNKSGWMALLWLGVVLASPALAGRSEPMYVPEPIMVPAGKSLAVVQQAVRKAIAAEEFTAREIAVGHIRAERTRTDKHEDSYTAVVDVQYDSKLVRLRYLDSKNLNHDPKTNTIHGTYNRWMRGIERSIRKELWSR